MKTMTEQYKTLQGFRDVLPGEQPYWYFVEKTATEVTQPYGYRRIETPILEETGVFHKTVGEGRDIAERERYSFDDRAGREGNRTNITVRPEGTAGSERASLRYALCRLAVAGQG